MIMSVFGCESVEDVEIPEGGGNDFFKPEDGQTKIRFLAGPLVYYVSQKFVNNKPEGDKKYYANGSEAAKKDKHAKLTFSYIIFEYEKGTKIGKGDVKQWDISTKKLLKTVQALNGLNPDLSLMDCLVTKKKGSNGYNEYNLVSGQNKIFENKEIIELFNNDNPFTKLQEVIAEKIEETSSSLSSIEDQEVDIEEAISANKETKAVKKEEVEEIFNKKDILEEEPKTTTDARESAKDDLEDDL